MTYTLSWYRPEQVLHLALEDQPTIQELQTINQHVVDLLEARQSDLSIIIDVTNLQAGYQTADHLRDTQAYMNHLYLDSAFIVANNKLNRLITLMAFRLSRAKFMQFDTLKKAEIFLQRYSLSTTS